MRHSIICLALLAAAPAAADSLPPAVRAMVETAARSGDKARIDAVVGVAKETNPDSSAEIDTIVSAIAEERAAAREAELLSAGVFDNWSGSGQLGASLATGNSDTRTFTAGLSLRRDGVNWRHRFDAIADFQRSSGSTDQERYLAGYQMDWKMSDRTYLWGRLEYERNREAGIRRRFSESAGFGWNAIRSDTVKWDLEAGPALRQTVFVDRDENIFAVRGASRFLWQLSDTTAFSNDTSVFVDGTTTIGNTAALTSKLMGALSARLAFNLAWEDSPPPGLEKLDTVTRVTFVYDF